VELRPATADDLAAEHDVFRAAIGDLFHRHAFNPPNPPVEAFVAQQGHLLETDAERCLVAVEKGEVAAYAAALVREGAWYLGSLFVHPEFQGRGIGPALLDGVWGDGFVRRSTLTDSIQPISNGLYGRRGLIPTTPVLTLAGRPTSGDPGLTPSEPAAAALAELDRVAYGFDRSPDHDYWQRHATATLWLRDGELVAYAYAWPQGRIGPVGGRDGEAAALALRAELARATGEVTVLVPGTSAELVEAGLATGLRISGPPGLLLLSRGVVAPTALAISGYTLF
jgi:GNAT superfamily N-acetyltransferase